MNKIYQEIKTKLPVFSYGEGVTYIEIKDLIDKIKDKKLKDLIANMLDDLFFAAPDDFNTKLPEFHKFITSAEEGSVDVNKKIEKEKKKIEDVELLNDFINESREGLIEYEAKLLELEGSKDLKKINEIFRIVHTIKGSTGFLELEELNKYAHVNENLLDDIRNGKIPVSSAVIEHLFNVLDIFKKTLDFLSDNISDGYFPEFDIDLKKNEIKVNELRENKISEEKTDIVINEKIIDTVEETESSDDIAEEEIIPKENSKNNDNVLKSIKVDIGKVDFLLDNVGELIVVNNMLFEDENILKILDKRTQNNLNQLKRISSRLQNSSMALRMVQIGNTFQKMLRIVRDNSKRLGKLIKLEINGQSTEIDRNMVDKLYDPLMHMIRNSCDHGIETNEERENAGKPLPGNIWLSAYHKGGNIVIEIKDDGKGLDKEKILKKAIEKGLINENDVLTDSEIYNTVFLPGFSTADKVSAISGRGVGMDVVKSIIGDLGGRVDIESKKGEGTVFYIRLPLTLAILDGVLIRIGDERFIIPAQVVEEGIAPSLNAVINMANKGEVIKVREKVFHFVRLYEFFEIEPTSKNPEDGIVIIVDTEKGKIGLLVDEIIGKQEVVIKNLGSFFKQYDYISGSAIMGDGTISLILDVNKFERV